MPLTILQVAAFQWVNPKALAMALTAIRLVGAVFGVINLPSVGSWTLLGQQMARVLTSPARLVVFNQDHGSPAGCLALSGAPALRFRPYRRQLQTGPSLVIQTAINGAWR